MKEQEPTTEQLERCEWVSNDGMRCEMTKWAHIKYSMNHLVPEPFWSAVRTEFIKKIDREKKERNERGKN